MPVKLKKTKKLVPDLLFTGTVTGTSTRLPRVGVRGCIPNNPTAGSKSLILHYDDVEKILNCIKTDTGVSPDGMDGKEKNPEHFTFPKPETIKIPIRDLTGYPVLSRIDLQEHTLY